jgi:predicted branched-subunit amino acid permease
MPDEPEPTMTSGAAYLGGLHAGVKSVFAYVMFGTFLGYGALCQGLEFSLPWSLLSTAIIWAGPAQLIMVTAIASGASAIEGAIAVTLSGIRLLPMVAALLPTLRTPATPMWHMLLPAHFTAASTWMEGQRLAPGIPRERRIAFYNGLGSMLTIYSLVATTVGFLLASQLPPVMAAAMLFLTPMSFLIGTYSNARMLIDKAALGLGLVLTPVFMLAKFDLALLIGGLAAGTLAYLFHRWRRAVCTPRSPRSVLISR